MEGETGKKAVSESVEPVSCVVPPFEQVRTAPANHGGDSTLRARLRPRTNDLTAASTSICQTVLPRLPVRGRVVDRFLTHEELDGFGLLKASCGPSASRPSGKEGAGGHVAVRHGARQPGRYLSQG